ncbi:MAG: putative zinc-binding protein [Spirochaetes bacterium]|nr:putative zinc-binding protein [Spirochaetota bacterium]
MADNCCSTEEIKLLYSCSGTADVGEVADKATRKLRDQGFGRMSCLAAIGADLSGYIESAKGAYENIAINGCPTQCATKTLERIGVTPTSFVLTDMGFKKGKSPVTDEAVDKILSLVKFVPMPGISAGGCACGGNC